MSMFTEGFRSNQTKSEPESIIAVPASILGTISLIAFLAALPFGVIWLFYVTAERSIPFYDRFNTWEWSKPAQLDKAASNASKAYQNVLRLEAGLRQFEGAGKDLWGFTHTWQIRDFQLNTETKDLEDRILDPSFAEALRKKTTPDTIENSSELRMHYGNLRVFYSRSKYVVDLLLENSRGAAKGLPDEATILKNLENQKVYADTQASLDDLERAKRLLATKIAPFFVSKPDGGILTENRAFISGFTSLIAIIIGALSYLLLRLSRRGKTKVLST